MIERLTHWKCPKCHGTGRVIRGLLGREKHAYKCDDCDGTGNAMVDGAAERHKRELAEIDERDEHPPLLPS